MAEQSLAEEDYPVNKNDIISTTSQQISNTVERIQTKEKLTMALHAVLKSFLLRALPII